MSSPPAPRRSWLRRVLNRLEVDRAVFYTIVGRAWQFVAGPVTMVLIALHFSPELQGYFYTFSSLLALQAFVELGLHVVLVHFVSHEWAQLRLEKGVPAGDAAALSRLAGVVRKTTLWYCGVGAVFALGLSAFGLLFFGETGGEPVEWQAPWLCLAAVTGLSLALVPLIAVLEGCDQVAVVSRTRILQGMTGSAVVWLLIPLGAELWTAVAIGAVRLAWEAWLVLVRYGRFFRHVLGTRGETTVDWRLEIWPLQWRFAVQALFAYFGVSLFTPVMFHYHGAAVAGRMGMTWSILSSVQAAALSWVQTRAPRFGILVARREFGELDRIFFRLTAISLGVLVVAGVGFWGVVLGINLLDWTPADAAHSAMDVVRHYGTRLAGRLLPPDATALFVTGIVLLHVPLCQSIYVRSHKIDPFIWLSPPANALIGLLVWQVGGQHGPIGAGAGYVAVAAALIVPGYYFIWRRCRRELH